MDMPSIGKNHEESATWHNDATPGKEATKRYRAHYADRDATVKRPRLYAPESASTHPRSSDVRSNRSTVSGLATLTPELFNVIATKTMLADYLSLARIDHATRLLCNSGPDSVGDLLATISLATSGSKIVKALATIGTMPPIWQASLLRRLAQRTGDVEVRNVSYLGEAWARAAHEAYRTQSTFSDASVRDAVLRDLVVTRLYHPSTRRGDDILRHHTLLLPTSYQCEIFEAHLGSSPLLADLFTKFVKTHDDASHAFSPSLAENVMTRLLGMPGLSNLSEHLSYRFDISEAFQRAHLDAKAAESIALDLHDATYDVLAAACERWRPGDVTFRASVEQATLRRYTATLLLDRHTQDGPPPPLLNAAEMQQHLRDFILAAEKDTAKALAHDPARIAHFLDLCQRLSVFNNIDSMATMSDVAASAPWQMQPVLLNRLLHLLARKNDRRDTLDAMEVADVDLTTARVAGYMPLLLKRCLAGGELALWERALGASFVTDTIAQRALWLANKANMPMQLTSRLGSTAPKHWGHALKTLANLPQREFESGGLPVSHQLISDTLLHAYVNYFLRDPEASLLSVDGKLFDAIESQIPKIWKLLPDAAGNLRDRLNTLAARLGLSDSQHLKLRKSMLESEVRRIIVGESTMEHGVQRFNIVEASDRRFIEDRVWTSLIRPQLSVSATTTPWLSELIGESAYLKQKIAVFMDSWPLLVA